MLVPLKLTHSPDMGIKALFLKYSVSKRLQPAFWIFKLSRIAHKFNQTGHPITMTALVLYRFCYWKQNFCSLCSASVAIIYYKHIITNTLVVLLPEIKFSSFHNCTIALYKHCTFEWKCTFLRQGEKKMWGEEEATEGLIQRRQDITW